MTTHQGAVRTPPRRIAQNAAAARSASAQLAHHPASPRSRLTRGKLGRPALLPSLPPMVESRCGAVAVGRTYLFPPLSSGGALVVRPWLRFHIPLIEPDRRIYRIRLSDKTSRLHPRRAAPKLGQAYEPEVLVEVREWISSRPCVARLCA